MVCVFNGSAKNGIRRPSSLLAFAIQARSGFVGAKVSDVRDQQEADEPHNWHDHDVAEAEPAAESEDRRVLNTAIWNQPGAGSCGVVRGLAFHLLELLIFPLLVVLNEMF